MTSSHLTLRRSSKRALSATSVRTLSRHSTRTFSLRESTQTSAHQADSRSYTHLSTVQATSRYARSSSASASPTLLSSRNRKIPTETSRPARIRTPRYARLSKLDSDTARKSSLTSSSQLTPTATALVSQYPTATITLCSAETK